MSSNMTAVVLQKELLTTNQNLLKIIGEGEINQK